MPLVWVIVMTNSVKGATDVLIVAVAETAGSSLYGMLDVLLAAGNVWQTRIRQRLDVSSA